MNSVFGAILGFLLLSSWETAANVRVLPRKIQDYGVMAIGLDPVPVVRVKGARLAWVNYVALKRDFPKLKNYTDARIDELLLRNFAYISVHQLPLSGLRNSPVPADESDTRTAYRPGGYRRADVMELLDFDGRLIGLVDRKGAGSDAANVKYNQEIAGTASGDELADRDHSDGLMTLGEALVETTRERARRRLYQIERTGGETVETYFVLHLPFSVLRSRGQQLPAGIYGRQAHLGRDLSFESPLPNSEGNAFQGDYFGAGVDQGAVLIMDERLRGTFQAEGYPKFDSQRSSDWAWAHDTANAFAATGERRAVEDHVRDMLKPLEGAGPDEIGVRSQTMTEDIRRFYTEFALAPHFKKRRVAAEAIGRQMYAPFLRTKAELLLMDPDNGVRLSALWAINRFPPRLKRKWVERLAATPGELALHKHLLHVLQHDRSNYERALRVISVNPCTSLLWP